MSQQRRVVKTHCGRMDHGGCSLLVEMEGSRIVGVKGDPDGFLNHGYLCPKGLASHRRLGYPGRLKHPLQRAGARGSGQWQRISWPRALETIARNLYQVREKHGARAVAFGLGMPKGLDHFGLIRLANAFGSPNVVANQDVCHAPREISGVHTCGFYPVADLHNPSSLVILWGSNITHTNEEGEIASLLLARLKEGSRLLVVDPRRGDLFSRASAWLQIRPGADAALALGLLHVIIKEKLYDREFVENWTHGFAQLARQVELFTPGEVSRLTWLEPGQIKEAARAYAAAKPACLVWGNPIEHNVNAFDTARALICLMALCGNLDAPGGNIQAVEPPIAPLGKFVRADLIPQKPKTMLSLPHGVIPRFMTIPPGLFRRAVLADEPYPVRALYAMGTNPMLTWAEAGLTRRALESLDFLAVAELVMTPTAALADIVLPAASHYEFDDIGHYGLGHGYVLARPRLLDPPGQCWPDLKIIAELGKRVSSPELWPEDYHGFLDDLLAPSGLSYEQFAARGHLRGEQRFYKYRQKGFRTPSGKVELMLSRAQDLGVKPLPELTGFPQKEDGDYPLLLTSRKNRLYLHSSYRWLDKLRNKSPQPLCELHPATAAALGIADGSPVVIETRHGRITQQARLSKGIHPKVVYAEYGWWFPEEEDDPLRGWQRANYNFLTTAQELGQEFGTPNLKAICCRVSRDD